MDYRISDALADSPGEGDTLHTERLIRLPRCAWCYRPPDESPLTVAPPPSEASGFVTFGCFNKHAKISPATLDLWAALLARVPTARLMIKWRSFADPDIRGRLIDDFSRRGVAPDRLDVIGGVQSLRDHLASYARIDVALDTFPYHGTTTTCDALYNGVPVVTLAGQTHASRVGISLLHAMGLPDLVAQTPDRYVEIAADVDRLIALRRQLRPRLQSSPLCDAAGLARAIESAYRQAWRAWCAAAR
jgi:predicted O-linked N-acetylglucosamine transferase (SPINDLY family)